MPTGKVQPLAAPIGGLNAKDAIAEMPPIDAIVADNWFIQPTWVETRDGYVVQATFTGVCETLMAYSGITGANKLFGAVNNAGTRSIFRMDGLSGGAVGAAVVGGGGNTIEALTSTQFDWVQFGTGSAEILYLVNGVDSPLIYDGTTWQAVTGVSNPYAITGVTTTTLSAVATYKQRLWFLQANTMNVWYLGLNQIAGAATQLNLAPNFALGGKLISIITVSIDNAAGAQDYIAFVTNQGEVAVFQGYDPSQIATWQLAAKFRIGRPVGTGRRCWQKMGSDALMIGADGFIMMSEALMTDRSQTRDAVSNKIRKSVTDDVQAYGSNFGWQVILYPIGNKVLVNVPPTTNVVSYQYVMNTLNSAWSTWNKVNNGYNAFCWEVMGDALYFGSNGFVAQADIGGLDGTSAITCVIQQAFNYFGDPGMVKRFTQARPIFVANGNMAAAVQMAIDYGPAPPSGSIPLIVGNNTPWGSAWGSAWGGSLVLSKAWVGLTGVGIAGSLSVATQVYNVQAQWQGTTVMYEPGGEFA
jgi:hypothetical protein